MDHHQTNNPIMRRIGAVPRCGGFRQDGYRVWGSSVVRGEDGRYHMFVSRVPAWVRFHPGWMVASEIMRASADEPIGPYRFEEVVLPARGAEYWDGRSTFNPRILKVDDGYLLFYTGSTHPFADITPENAGQLTAESCWCTVGRANKRIGIASSEHIGGPWRRQDRPALPTRPGTFYSFLTSNAAPAVGADGRIHLIFKSRHYVGSRHSYMHIGLAIADGPGQPFEVVTETPLFGPDHVGEVEDPYLWSDEDGFHLMAKDQHGGISGEAGAGILAHSHDCRHWSLDPDPKAYSRRIVWDDGTPETLDNMERCAGLIENGKLTHLFFAVWRGAGGFSVEDERATSWNIVVPLTEQRREGKR